MSNPVDERAERWRQAQAQPQATTADGLDAMVTGMAELQAQLDDARKALQGRQPRERSIRIRSSLPAWLQLIVYPLALWLLWDCVRVVLLGGKIR